jgi:hypothetical protein
LSATEIAGWREYFQIYPFTQDREDWRAAMLAAVISNVSGRMLKRMINETVFLPRYLDEVRTPSREKSLEQQHAEFLAFKEKVRAVRPDWVRDKAQ